jgi:hypothetical protein
MIVVIQVMNRIVMVKRNLTVLKKKIRIFFVLERTCDPLTQFTCPHTPGKCIPNGMLKKKISF